jgi:hypothetical protein
VGKSESRDEDQIGGDPIESVAFADGQNGEEDGEEQDCGDGGGYSLEIESPEAGKKFRRRALRGSIVAAQTQDVPKAVPPAKIPADCSDGRDQREERGEEGALKKDASVSGDTIAAESSKMDDEVGDPEDDENDQYSDTKTREVDHLVLAEKPLASGGERISFGRKSDERNRDRNSTTQGRINSTCRGWCRVTRWMNE